MKININDTKFLKFEDLKHKDIVVVNSEGKWQDSDTFTNDDGTPSREFRIDLRLPNGEIRNTTLRSTNVRWIGQGLGEESKDWIGKELRAWKTKSDRAKAGYVYVFVRPDWERDDTGEWIIPQTETQETRPSAIGEEGVNDIPF